MVSCCKDTDFYLTLRQRNIKKEESMAVIIINGSPRKNFSTARLCARFADGVQDVRPDKENNHH